MKQSSFQFTNPVLTHLKFDINKDSVRNSEHQQELTVNNEMSVNIGKHESEPKASVELTIDIRFENDKAAPFFLEATMAAVFKWKDDDDAQTIDALLSQNAPSLLLSYLRPIVANVTNSSSVGIYHVPFMNFTEE